MAFALFIASMLAISLMSTTKESREEARQAAIARGDHKKWRLLAFVCWGILLSMFVF